MKGTILNYRYWILGALAFAAFVLCVGEPSSYADGWLRTFATAKLGAVVLSLAAYGLYRRWAKQGRMRELDEFVNGETYTER